MRKVYLDNAATTRPHPKVVEAMQPYFSELFGNPLSLHPYGQEAKKAIEGAREKVAKLINAKPAEIIFTSTGTEANNFAIKGAAAAHQQKGKHIIISGIEHHSVLYSAKALEKQGYKVTLLPVDKFGIVSPEDVLNAITPETTLVSVMHANNEIGTIEPISEISKVAKEKGVILHADAAMSVGNIPVDVAELGVDMLTISAHKFYGPKGVGALYIKKGARILPFMHGGIQEDGRRAGADNVPGIVGLGKAAEIAMEELPDRVNRITPLRDKLIKGLTEKIEHLQVNGHLTNRLPGNVNVCIEFIEGEAMLLFLIKEGIAASSGSTCTSKALKASHVLLAIGVPDAAAQGSLLFSFGRETTEEDIDHVLTVLPPIVERLRAMSPIYNK